MALKNLSKREAIIIKSNIIKNLNTDELENFLLDIDNSDTFEELTNKSQKLIIQAEKQINLF